MTNRLLGMLAASLLVVSACGGEGDGAEETSNDALASEFQNSESRASRGDAGVGDGQGRGNCGRGKARGMGRGKGPMQRADAADEATARADVDADADEAADEATSERGADRADVDVDADEAADEATSEGSDRAAGGPGKGNGRCRDQSGARDGGVQPRDGGVRQPRDGGIRGERVDAGPQVVTRDAGRVNTGSGQTVTLPDGSTVRVDPSCPSLTRSGVTLPGCCLAANTCGLSTHLIDVTGVPKGCQDYAQARQVDPTFDLQAKACTFRN